MKSKIFKQLENVKFGYLVIKTPCENEIDIGDKNSELKADITIKDWEMLDLVMLKGDIGLGESYIRDLFTTTKIENLLLFICNNQKELESLFHGKTLYSLFFLIKNIFKRNSLKGSKKNIQYHYDLGNDFYSLWLDDTMSYSSGIFYKEESLRESQINKYQRILGELNSNGLNILEIGCGWGGFINEASKEGYKVKGLTLSHEQKDYSDKLILDNNLSSEIALQDYRLERDKYDNIVSIEMFEAVGRKYWDGYFSKIKDCLKENGRAVIQTIVIADEFYSKYLKTSDYIREYIFPGGFLPSPNIMHNLAKKHGLKVINEMNFGYSYAKTLIKWLEKFDEEKKSILELGYSEEFIRKWRFYLAYCAASFNVNRTDVIQYTLTHE